MRSLEIIDLATMPYADALRMQLALASSVQADPSEPGRILLVEHDPPVITLGRRGRRDSILVSDERLSSLGVEVHRIRRGGDATAHCRGQLVVYPILHLDRMGIRLRGFISALEQTVIRMMSRLGLRGEVRDGLTGVWSGDDGGKVASIGIAVSKRVTYHGLAVNVSGSMDTFDLIVPCGLRGCKAVSLSQLLDAEVSMDRAKDLLVESMCEVLDAEVANVA
jgi:lipoate-protein ligase B